nr:hypothetical protein [Heyndrickxia coagulans]
MVRQVKKTKSFLLTAAFVAFNFCFFTNISVAESPATDGFIIEADRVEGVMLPPEITAGDTAIKQNQVMLRLQYADVTIYGLKITKVLQTPEGPVTIHMNAPGPIQLKNMKDDATKVDFGSIYVPEKAGQIGMKNVRLVAHQQLADNADLPGLDLSMETGAANIDTSSSDEETLRKQADQLTQLLKGGTSDQNKEEKNGKPVTADKAKAGTQDKAKTETQDTEKHHDAKTDGKVTDQNKNKNKKPENADDTKTKNAEETKSDNTGTKPASGQETEKNGTPAKTAPSQSTDKNVQQKEGSNAGN